MSKKAALHKVYFLKYVGYYSKKQYTWIWLTKRPIYLKGIGDSKAFPILNENSLIISNLEGSSARTVYLKLRYYLYPIFQLTNTFIKKQFIQ